MKKHLFLFLLVFLAACGPVTPVPSPTATIPPTQPPTPTATILPSQTPHSIIITATPKPFATWTSYGQTEIETAGLLVRIWELAAPPEIDPLKFITKDLETHTAPEIGYGEIFITAWVDSAPPSVAVWIGDKRLVARDIFDMGNGSVSVYIGNVSKEAIYSIETGKGSPISGLQGFWAYDNHWMLETNFYSDDTPINGRITEDGILINEKYGYEEAFGSQPIEGKPFYFFKRDGKIDAWYNGQEITLGFDQIPHYGCCSAAELNPKRWTNMVAFFGVRGKTWYFVQIGTPETLK